jgi:hypothetical protein
MASDLALAVLTQPSSCESCCDQLKEVLISDTERSARGDVRAVKRDSPNGNFTHLLIGN